MVVAVVSDFKINLCRTFSIFCECLVLSVVTRIALHIRDVDGLVICIGRGLALVFMLEIAGNEPQSLGCFEAFLFCFCHLRSLVMIFPKSHL